MKFSTLLTGAVALFSCEVIATSLTYRVEAHERACFYANTKNANEKIAFYFAVRTRSGYTTLRNEMGKVLMPLIGPIRRLVRYRL